MSGIIPLSLQSLSAGSRLVQRLRRRYPQELPLLPAGAPTQATMQTCLAALRQTHGCADALRILRQLVIERLVVLDCEQAAPLAVVTRAVTELAELALDAAWHEACAQLDAAHGTPRTADGRDAVLWIVGMGKLGARELNVSSDIDLIYVYDADGETTGLADGRGRISNHDYFTKAVKRIYQLIGDTSAHGFVFRVDLALRPNGNSGPSVVSLDALEEYFQVQGREWERFAWLKSRVVAPFGAIASATALRDTVLPFVFRRYLDYSVFEALRGLHQQIRQHAQRRSAGRPERANDVKLSRGGIREIEFTVQLLQVVRGGQFPELRTRPTLAALQHVAKARLMDEATAQALREGRTFYSYNRGTPELRAALVAYHRRIWGVELPESRIALTLSGMNAVMQVAQATVEPGDSVVTITPSWPNIVRAMQINGAEIREVSLHRGNEGWRLDLDDVFAACDETTRVIYLASPGNPTGWMIGRGQAEALLAFARARNIAILSDEVYHRIVYDRPHAFSFLEIARPDDPLFVINSFSKAWAMTGWRLGWVVYPDYALPTFEKLIQFNTSGGVEFLQAGCIAALEQGEDFVHSFVERCRTARGIANARLDAMRGVRNIPSMGAFYAMFEVEGVTDTLTFCQRAAVEAGIGMAPGTAFGRGAEHLVRLCYAKSAENITEAMDRLERFVAGYRA